MASFLFLGAKLELVLYSHWPQTDLFDPIVQLMFATLIHNSHGCANGLKMKAQSISTGFMFDCLSLAPCLSYLLHFVEKKSVHF